MGRLHRPVGIGQVDAAQRLGLLDSADDGTYLLAGQNVHELDDAGRARVRNRLLGFVFQLHNLLPRTTALENVATPLVYRGVRRWSASGWPTTRSRWSAWPTAPTTIPTSSPAARCSGSPSRAPWSGDPEVLLVDEPTGNLDLQATGEVLELLDRLHDQGRTIVMITHEEDVAEHADRRLVLGDGILHDYHSPAAEAHQ